MAREKQTYVRPQPAHKRVAGSKTLAHMWSDDGLAAQAPPRERTEDNLYGNFDLSVDGAIDKASENFRSTQERDKAAFLQRQQARAEKAKPQGAVAGVAEDLAGEAAAAQRKAMLDNMSVEERNAWFQELLERESDDTAVTTDLSDDDDELTPYNWMDAQDEADAQAGQEWDAGADTEYAAGFEGYSEGTQEAAAGVLEDIAGDEA